MKKEGANHLGKRRKSPAPDTGVPSKKHADKLEQTTRTPDIL